MPKNKIKKKKQLNSYIKYSSLTTQMAVIIAAGAFFGDYLDNKEKWIIATKFGHIINKNNRIDSFDLNSVKIQRVGIVPFAVCHFCDDSTSR